MDDLVRQALARWPAVPDCTGWLALDARGRWRIGEAEAGQRKPVTHTAMIAFINRNYLAAGRCWIFQNGPQRVFVELEYTPFVWRLVPREAGAWDLVAHIGVTAIPCGVWLDDGGRFLIEARVPTGELWVGVLHDHDTALLADLLRDRDGEALDDEAVTRLTSATPDGAAGIARQTGARLHWIAANGAPLALPLQRIAADAVAARFEFEPRPSKVVRIDVDTRR